MVRLRRLVLERLMRYYRFLSEGRAKKNAETVTSAEIAEALDIDATQVRKDFGAIGLLGMGRVGFDVCEVCWAIRVELGFDQVREAILVGAGHLGGALVAYGGFAPYGLRFVAAFDKDPARVGTTIAGCEVRPMRGMKAFIRNNGIRVAVLTTPQEASQVVADRLVAAGITAIWNFAPRRLTAPPYVLVRNEHISLGLAEITYHLRQEPR